MRCRKLNDKRSFYQKVKDFIFGEKLTDEEKAERKEQERVAHAHMLGAGGGVTGKIEVIRSKDLHKEEED